MVVILLVLGANYQGGKQNEQQQQQVEESRIMVASVRSHLISSQASSESTRVPNTRPVSRVSHQHSNNSDKRTGNSGDTLRSTPVYASNRKQQSKPKPIMNKPSTSTPPNSSEPKPTEPKPTEPSPAPTPTEPTNPETPTDTVYLLSADTEVAGVHIDIDALPVKKQHRNRKHKEVNINVDLRKAFR